MSVLRPLPPRPSLEFERKEAKALLRLLRRGDPGALMRARTRHPAIDGAGTERIALADAQLVIAREYGFTSWPRLVHYFQAVERQRHSRRTIHRREFYEGSVHSLLAGHRERRASAGRALAAYVPRCYGMRLEDVFAAAVTEDEARLAVARTHGFPSWDVLLDQTTTESAHLHDEWDVDPMRYAAKVMADADLAALERVVEEHPDLLHPSAQDAAMGRNLLAVALAHERRLGRAAMHRIMQWLEAQGLEVQEELNRQLCGRKIKVETDDVRWLLERGADPDWIAPNGVSVLEHALIRYWNGEAVDLVAARTTPRRALWIAAGLGEVEGVRHWLDGAGRPRPEARRLRPDFDAVGPFNTLAHPDPDDEEILAEAFFVAMLNGRTAVLEYMVSRGFPVDSLIYGTPMINLAVGNAWTPVVKCLVRCGADLDLRGRHPDMTARELARELFEERPEHADLRHIVEWCGMHPDAILAEWDARHKEPPGIEPKLAEALELAGDDALRLGQSAIGPENLLFGLLGSGGPPLLYFTRVSRVDLDRFRDAVRERLPGAEERANGPRLPLDPDAEAAVRAATAVAAERRREAVRGVHLLYALLQEPGGVAAKLLTEYGGNTATLMAGLEREI
jgi:hypothetical protein